MGTIYDSIVSWANEEKATTPEDTAKNLKTKLPALAIAEGAMLSSILNAVKYSKSSEKKLTGAGLEKISLVIKALTPSPEKQAKSKMPFADSVLRLIQGRSPASIKNEIDKEVFALQKQKLLGINKNSAEPLKEELALLIAAALPNMTKSERKKVCELLIELRTETLSECLDNAYRDVLKPLVKELYKNGLFYKALDAAIDSKGYKPSGQLEIIDAIKEEMTIRPKLTVKNLLLSKAEFSLRIPPQMLEKKFLLASKSFCHSLIAQAAAEKLVERSSLTAEKRKNLESEIENRLEGAKGNAVSILAHEKSSEQVQDGYKDARSIYDSLQAYLPEKKEVGIVARALGNVHSRRREIDKLFDAPPTERNLQQIQKLIDKLLEDSSLNPKLMENAIKELHFMVNLEDADYKDASLAIASYDVSYRRDNQNPLSIDCLKNAKKALDNLGDRWEILDFNRYPALGEYLKHGAKIASSRKESLAVHVEPPRKE